MSPTPILQSFQTIFKGRFCVLSMKVGAGNEASLLLSKSLVEGKTLSACLRLQGVMEFWQMEQRRVMLSTRGKLTCSHKSVQHRKMDKMRTSWAIVFWMLNSISFSILWMKQESSKEKWCRKDVIFVFNDLIRLVLKDTAINKILHNQTIFPALSNYLCMHLTLQNWNNLMPFLHCILKSYQESIWPLSKRFYCGYLCQNKRASAIKELFDWLMGKDSQTSGIENKRLLEVEVSIFWEWRAAQL